MTTITQTIDPPLPTDTPAVFNTKAFTAWGALNTWASQANNVAGEVNTNAGTATTQAGIASTKAGEAVISADTAATSAMIAQNAAVSSGAVLWVSGTTYTLGFLVYSPINYQNYRRIIAGAGTTDPSLDTTNWTAVGLSATGTATLTNKTIEAGVFTNGYTEEVYAPAAGSAFTVSLANGSIQGFTTNANTTITLPTVVAGKSFQLQIAFGGAHTITFAGGTVKWTTTPTFSGASGKTDVVNFTANAAGTAWFGSVFGLGYTT